MILSNKKRRLFDISTSVAHLSSGVGGSRGNNFRIGAVLAIRNSVLSVGVNSYRSHRALTRFYRFPFTHAEADAILRAGLNACNGADLYVSRIRRDGSIALAKPCEECMQLIKVANIRKIYYTTEEGYACI